MSTIPERLYLSKESDVYVSDCLKLRQNQISALRYLFQLFIKKKPGAILNNPPGSGKGVVVALFIEAIQKLLTYPVLILCNRDEELEYWKQTLLDWTKFTVDDIAVETPIPIVRKYVSIKKATNINSYISRKWSFLLIKSDEISKDIGRLKFDADFKMWITTVDIYCDLLLLSEGLNWINPKLCFNVKDFEMKNKNTKEKVQRLIRLECFTEDIVIRTGNVKSILMKSTELVRDAHMSKKNKDASGTKIKRSKRKIIDEHPKGATSPEKDTINGTECKLGKILDGRLENSEPEVVDESSKPNDHDEIEMNETNTPSIIHLDTITSDFNENTKSAGDDVYKFVMDRSNASKDRSRSSQGEYETHDSDSTDADSFNEIKMNVSNCFLSMSNDISAECVSNEHRKSGNVVEDTLKLEAAAIVDNNEHDLDKTVENIASVSTSNYNKLSVDKTNSIDKKLRAMEEKTLNKYKGTFLDSIF